jgi:hypothetical protein
MKDFFHFIKKIALFGLILAALLWVIFFVLMPPNYADSFSAIYIKHRYLEKASSPKIILLGGSNVFYGVDSALLEQRFNRPVINMALQAGIPLSLQANEIAPFLSPGDLVVLIPEYGYYVFPEGGNPSIARLLEVYPQDTIYLDDTVRKDLPQLIKLVFQQKYARLRSAGAISLPHLGQLLDPADHLTAPFLAIFSPQGDVLAHLDLPGRQIDNTPFFAYTQVVPVAFPILNQIGQVVAKKGATAVLTFPSGRQTNCQNTAADIAKLVQDIQTKIQMPVVGTPQRYCFPDPYFFDTSYHLLREGRRLRTEQMAVDLAPFVK